MSFLIQSLWVGGLILPPFIRNMGKSKRKKRSIRSKTGYFGSMQKNGKYQAFIWIDGKNKYLGSSYATAKQAAKAYDEEAIKLRRPFSKLNFPEKAPVGYTPMQQALLSRNTVGYRGVHKNRNKFRAYIDIDGNRTYISTYDTAKEAAIAYDRFIRSKNLEHSLSLNFPDEINNHPLQLPARRKKSSKSGFSGVCPQGSKKNPWRAYVTLRGNRVNLGVYAYAFQAACVYDEYCKKNKINRYKLNFGDNNLSFEIQKTVLPIIRSHLDVNSSSSSSSSTTSSSNNVTTVNVTINDVVHVVPLKAKDGYDISYIFKLGDTTTNIVNLHGNPINVE